MKNSTKKAATKQIDETKTEETLSLKVRATRAAMGSTGQRDEMKGTPGDFLVNAYSIFEHEEAVYDGINRIADEIEICRGALESESIDDSVIDNHLFAIVRRLRILAEVESMIAFQIEQLHASDLAAAMNAGRVAS